METEWVQVMSRLREQLGERNFATWIEPIRCIREDDGLRLEVASPFFQEWVTSHFLSSIREVVSDVAGSEVGVRVVVGPRQSRSSVPAPQGARVASRSAATRGARIGRLISDYTFDRFVLGEANEVAHGAARSVAEAPGRRFNPLFVWGGVGLGKTHLANALGHELIERRPRCRMGCLSAESFMNALINSLRQDQMAAFRARFRDLDVLILDDVQFLAGKDRTQEEFFHTFNDLYGASRQIVLTSDKPPHAIAQLEHRLKSRFEGGLIADIHPPTDEMRIAIVRKKAALQGVDLSVEVASIIAERSGATVRELEGGLTRVLASAALRDLPLNPDTVRGILAPLARERVSVDAIQAVVSDHFRVTVSDLTSHRRDRKATEARQVAMYLSRSLADLSFPSIAERFGGRDHSTVIHAVRTVEARRNVDPDTGALLRTLERQVRSGKGT